MGDYSAQHLINENNSSQENISPTSQQAHITVTNGEENSTITSAQAMRQNTGKLQYSLLDLNCLAPCVEVLEYGALKYARNNWKKGQPLTQIIDSLLRHITALQSGELIDQESGLSHIGHIQCNALFLACDKNTNDLLGD